jgi:hypothetical protein
LQFNLKCWENAFWVPLQIAPGGLMGILTELATSRAITLEPENLIGRSARCIVSLTSGVASSVHASLRWTPEGWALKDLSSTNGTFLNGRRLERGRAQLVTKGDILAFGAVERGWALADQQPPVPMAIADDGECNHGSDLIAVPSGELPIVTLYRSSDGAWWAEGADRALQGIADGSEFEVAGKRWRFRCPTLIAQTELLQHVDVEEISLAFAVSRDEEHVELSARADGKTIDLGARANNYLLLTLARQRDEDRRSGFEASCQGWMHQDAIAKALGADPDSINVDVFRIRKRFGQHFRNAARIIERRPRTGQLRLGVDVFEIRHL